ncbi:uncharacterized protein LOC100837147 [Brachypodium distachyon]|uniref:uncharacterized protein LOC100837147 n=1 Tax=Brachypodium distachyon TaxID=15368 RepID=UPI0001C75148|nr:uncharacterized protein LOC100837147 [Brachypodium distachyon]|eukprot:XP_010233471.1 uncharacterized protein LOC100837147 [Brachypodium distachyon]
MGGIHRGGDTDGLHSQRPNHRFAGVGPLMKQGGEAGILSDPLFGGNRLCSPKRAGRDKKKKLIDGVSGDVIARHTSPGILGRLMGLDMMPSSGVHSQNTCNGNHSQDMLPESCRDESWSCHDKYAFAGDVSRRTSTDEVPEFKDVFEVMETTRVKNQNHDTSSRHDKVNSADLNFARQKFMDAKRLSTDESFQRSKEFNDAVDALVSNKELLMEILQESTASDLCDLNCSPSSGLNCITLLKPSRRNKFIDADVVYPPEEDTGRCFHAPKEAKHSPRNPSISFPNQPLKEGTSSFRQKLSRSSYKERVDKRISPTRIVVLKPCIEKTQNMEGAFPLTHDMFCSSYRRTNTCLDDDGIRRPYAEGRMPQISTGYSDVRCHTGKGYREIAQEVSTQMKTPVKGGASGKQKLNPNIGVSNWDDQVPLLSSNGLKCSAASQRSSGLCEAPGAHRLGASPTYSTKTSIRKEARRRLSDRWKVTHQYQQPSQDANTFCTLGDMLALSHKEASKRTSGETACEQSPNVELHRTVMPGSCGYSLGIGSNDGWKDEDICNLTRLESIFTSSIDRGSPKLSSRKASCTYDEYSMVENIIRAGPYSEDLHHDRPRRSLVRSSTNPSLDEVESMVTEHEIHVNFEEPTYAVAVPELSETGGRLVPARNSNCRLGAERYLDNSSAVPEWQHEARSSAQNKMMDQEQTCTLDDRLFSNSLRDPASQADESGHDRYEDHQAPSDHLTESLSAGSSSEDDQPSPVSVLESSLDADDCCSGGFEKISADLQELRMQLRLLKMDAADNADETELALSSGDDTAASCELVNESGLPSCTFWDEDGRDFSYVDDMLACLGIQSAEQVLLLNARYLSGSPACSDVYDHLEKKYSKLILWPQSERRLLFDLTNAILVDMITCLTHCGGKGLVKKRELSMKWDKEGLVQEVWERVCRQRRETECFQEERLMGVGWLDCEDVTDEIAGDIGSMVGEDLLEEAIADLIPLKVFVKEKEVISERQII